MTGLLAIDPNDRGQVERLTQAIDDEFASRGWASRGIPEPDIVDAIAGALRRFRDDPDV